jgi:hypothetical protein
MFLFRYFGMYVVKVLGGHSQGKCRKVMIKYAFQGQTTASRSYKWLLCLHQHACIWITTKLYCKCKYNYLLYCQHLWLNMHFIFCWYILIISWQDYNNTFINTQGSSLEQIRERPTGFLMMEVISSRWELHYSRSGLWTWYTLCIIWLISFVLESIDIWLVWLIWSKRCILCNIWLIDIYECVIHRCLLLDVAYVCTIRLLNPI